jgi:hypothetical protein
MAQNHAHLARYAALIEFATPLLLFFLVCKPLKRKRMGHG